MAHICLIRTPMIVVQLVQLRSTCPPIGLAYFSASLKSEGHKVQIIDSVGEAIFQILPINDGTHLAHGLSAEQIIEKIDSDCEIIGISCMFSVEWPIALNVIQKIKKTYPEKKIIIGGEHVTATAKWILETTPEVDFCVLGEGEQTLRELINALSTKSSTSHIPAILSRESNKRAQDKQISLNLKSLRIQSIDDLPLPDWDSIPIRQYLDNNFGYGANRGRNMPMLATRGCPYQSTFCSSPQMWTTKWISRTPENVLAEMELYIKKYQADNFSFYDLTAIVKREWIIEFCKLILEKGHSFTWQLPSGTKSEAIDDEVAALLYKSGCRNLSYAPESGAATVLKRIKKKVHLGTMKKPMKACLNNGLVIKSITIIGFPGEIHKEIWQIMKWITNIALIGVHETTITGYIPYPGTEIFNYLQASKKIENYSEKYFLSLATTADLTKTKSWSEHISDRQLAYYRLFGLLMFYAISLSIRPKRFFKPLFNVILKKPDESRMEASIRVLFKIAIQFS